VEKDVCWKMHTTYARLPKVRERTREKRKHDEIPCMTNLDVPTIHFSRMREVCCLGETNLPMVKSPRDHTRISIDSTIKETGKTFW
jgi:hypothetical protein